MKIEQHNKQKFEPITLTIETEQELTLMMSLLGAISDHEVQKLTGTKVQEDFVYKAYYVLSEIHHLRNMPEGISLNEITCRN